MERTNLIIIRASDFLLQLKREFISASERSTETLMVHPECLKLISSLLPTNQVAILIDFADPEITNWMHDVLLNDLKL